jgi:ATP-dependent Zn protease
MTDQYLLERQRQKLGLSAPKEEKKPKQIAPLNKRRAKMQPKYRSLVKEMLAENDRCEVKSPVCKGRATGLQHKVKRSEKNLMDKKNLLRSCNACNGWIEANPLEAIAMGVSKSKHINQCLKKQYHSPLHRRNS